MSELTLHHADGTPCPVGSSLVLEEARTYVVNHPRASQVWLSERQLRRTDMGWVLPIESWAGAAVLRVVVTGSEERFPVQVQPRAEKLDDAAWQTMLGELEIWASGITAGLAGGRLGGVKLGLPLPILTEALLPLMALFSRNLMAVHHSPLFRPREHVEDVPLHMVRCVSGDLIVWLGTNPTGAQHLDAAARAEDLLGAPPLIPALQADESVDHPANRFVAWLCQRVIKRLEVCGDIWRSHAVDGGDRAEWASARAAECTTAAQTLQRMVRQTFLHSIPSSPPTEAAHLVIADEPAYARFHRLARLVLSPMFDAVGDSATAVPIRESYSLYELWCFLEVQRRVAAALPGASWQAKNLATLLDPSGTGAGAQYCATLPGERELRIEFNPTFRSFWTRGDSPRWSLSKERRPDIVVSVRGAGFPPRWLFLDAKYRVKRDYLGEAFESVHIYRDSLRDDAFGGPCVSGALLAPRQLADAAQWFSDDFRAAHGCAVFALTPGSPSSHLGAWIVRELGL